MLTYDFKFDDEYSGIDYSWFRRKIADSDAGYLLDFVDACRNGTVGFSKRSKRPDQRLIGELKGVLPTKVIYTSGRSAQLAWEEFLHWMSGQTVGIYPDGETNYYEQDVEDLLTKLDTGYDRQKDPLAWD